MAVWIFLSIGELVLCDVAGKNGAFRGKQEKLAQGKLLILAELEGESGFASIQMRKEFLNEFDFLLGLLVAAFGFFGTGGFPFFQGGHV